MKKKYNAPKAQLMTLHAQSPLLTLSGNTGDDTPGIGIGGNASGNRDEEGNLPDPEAKSQNAWNTWEEW